MEQILNKQDHWKTALHGSKVNEGNVFHVIDTAGTCVEIGLDLVPDEAITGGLEVIGQFIAEALSGF